MPYWKTSTINPKVALTDRLFITTAFIGTSTERNATARSTALAASTSATSIGNRSIMSS